MTMGVQSAGWVPPDEDRLRSWGEDAALDELQRAALALTLEGFGSAVSYSRKVFIPLTQLCRDVCHYCTFARAPRRLQAAYLTPERVLDIARVGQQAGCAEALFTLGDKPELRHRVAREELDRLKFSSTVGYLASVARQVFDHTGLLPHINAGVLARDDYLKLRPVSVSMGLMLESSSERLTSKGGPHHGSPDKAPAVRLATLELAGQLRVPMTTGLLIGIGETRTERIDALLALRALNERYGHLQEIIIQNFRAKPQTRMARAPEPPLVEMLWTIAMTRLAFGPSMSIQAPPNLHPAALAELLSAGINDWGGISPVTQDYVNPEAPWPRIEQLDAVTASAGRDLVERIALVPRHARAAAQWVDPGLRPAVRAMIDSSGFRREQAWHAGVSPSAPPLPIRRPFHRSSLLDLTIKRALRGERLTHAQLVRLFEARGAEAAAVAAAADELRKVAVGETVSYVINRNINYTNICLYRCGFCAFSKGGNRALRGEGYRLDLDEIARRATEAYEAGATEVCLQGGIHPSFTGKTYLEIVATIKRTQPNLHVHAFSPLEILHGARTLDMATASYLARLRHSGLSTLPGTAAEILCDEVRKIICPDKLSTSQWLSVVAEAHAAGLRSTATIMFGHIEAPHHWAEHLLLIRDLASRTGGITEFVPLPFVHVGAPLFRGGSARAGPTFREALLMHAIARLALHPFIPNIQTSWVKMGPEGAARCLQAGANDLGGTLMNESITRAAGGVHGQQFDAERMAVLTQSIGRPVRQRTTLYEPVACHFDRPVLRAQSGGVS